jgi:hydroxymethylpyrimidine pyrophosphatase-like HAD family hydrolase
VTAVLRHRALLACDLDGTLLDAEGAPVHDIGPTLVALRAAGAPLVVCTGRPLHAARRAIERLGVKPAVYVCYHGALVVDPDADRQLRYLPLPPAAASALAGEALGQGLGVTVYEVDEPRELVHPVAGPKPRDDVRSRGLEPESDLLGPSVTRLVLHGRPEPVSLLLPGLMTRWAGRLRVEPIRPGFVGVLHARADKGDAVRLTAAYLGVTLDRVIACGDSEADESLLRVAGVRVAVGDAPLALRRLKPLVVRREDLAATLRTEVGALL